MQVAAAGDAPQQKGQTQEHEQCAKHDERSPDEPVHGRAWYSAARAPQPRGARQYATRASAFSVKRASAERKRRRHDRAHAVRIEPPRARAGHEAGDENAEAAVLADGVALVAGRRSRGCAGIPAAAGAGLRAGPAGRRRRRVQAAAPASAGASRRGPVRPAAAGRSRLRGERRARRSCSCRSRFARGLSRSAPPRARCTRSTRTSAASGWVATNEEMTHRALVVRAEGVVAHGPARRGAGRAGASANDRR